jgi:hypothetical protein
MGLGSKPHWSYENPEMKIQESTAAAREIRKNMLALSSDIDADHLKAAITTSQSVDTLLLSADSGGLVKSHCTSTDRQPHCRYRESVLVTDL